MASEPDSITVTVKVPFGGDRIVSTQPLVTVKELTETILATCQTESFREIPQCIVHSGRILPESSTLQDVGISNGAVLHLMRRPRNQRRIPGRSRSSQSRSSRNAPTDDPNSGDVSELNDDDDDELEHNLDHQTEHHVHTNVIIGHIAVDGRIRYSDAHDMLLSVLHAIGFSTRAVRSAAAVAAAIAIATQSSEERGGASRVVLQNAWEATRRLQEQLSRETVTASSTTTSTTDGETHAVAENGSTPTTPGTTDEPAETSPSSSKESASAPAGEPAQPVPMSTDAGAAAESSSSASQSGTPDAATSIHRSIPALLSEDPPPRQQGETDFQASGRAADRLMPVLADLMEVSVSRLRNAPSMVDIEGSDRLEAAEILTEQLGSVASVVTFVTTLISTLLPDPDDLRTSNRSDRNRGTGGTQGSEQGRQGDTGASQANRTRLSALDGNTGSSETGGARQGTPQTGQTGIASSDGSSRASRTRSSSSNENASRSGSQMFDLSLAGNSSERNQGVSGSNRRIRRSRRIRVSSSQASNADFMIRVLSYYFCSISDLNIPTGSGPPQVDGQTAVSVLDSLYGSNNTAQPANSFLRIIHFAMQKLTPWQFHDICRGNMAPLAAIRQDLWEEISRQVRREHGSSIERGEVEELLVDHICEALHEFVHVLESADEANEDGVFTPGPEDFCHHIMHIVQRKTEIFANILAVRRSEQDFSGRMSRWVKGAIGEILLAIAMELEMQWDGLLTSFRRAAYEVGKTVVGSQFSVIFPCIANLFANRAKDSYQRIASRHPEARHSHAGQADTNGELDHSSCGPGCERQQAMLDGDSSSSFSHDADDDYSHEETDSDMPDLGEQDSDSDNDSMGDSHSESDNAMDTDTGRTDRKSMILDDMELRELADELDSEAKKTRVSTEVEGGPEEMDFEAIASELAAEVGSATAKSSAASVSSSKPKKLPTGPSKRMAAKPSGETIIPVRTSSVNPVLSMPVPSSSASRAAFSSAAVSRGGSSSGDSQLKNDFQKILGVQDGLRWKQVIERDQVRVGERHYGPLSRGYSGVTSVPEPLDSKRGAEMAVEAAKEAAKQAKLSPERARELERVASESGSQYMQEMERAIGSRLRTDPDFNRQGFPRAAKRFLPKES